MSRFAATLAVPKSMYRHFTVITLLLTACIAIFADGERRQGINDEIDAQNQKAALRQAEVDKNGPNKVGRQEIHYASRGGGGADGVEDTSPSVNPEGGGYSVGDGNGGMRVAGGGDFGMIGPLTQADVRAGKLPLARTGPAPGKNALKTITAAQRKAFDNVLAVRAGAATPPN